MGWVAQLKLLRGMMLSVKVLSHLLREGQVRAALMYALSPITRPISTTLATSPMRTLRLARWVPGAVGAALLGYATVTFAASSLPEMLLHAAGAVGGLALLAMSTALVLLDAPLWREYVATWRRYAVRALALALLLGMTTALAPRGSLASALLVALVVWLGTAAWLEHLVECLLWRRRHRVAGSTTTLVLDRHALTEEQLHSVCVHEAGHLMLFGLLARLPEDAFAMVDTKPRFDFAGFVTPMRDIEPIDMSPGLLRWQVMVALAGAAAEQLVIGRYTEGATADFNMAEKTLRRLGALDHAQPYFRTPAGAGEDAVNASTLAALRVELFDAALRYLTENRALLERVAAHLAAHGSMDCEEFAPIWGEAATPPGFARVNPPRHIACLQLP